MEAWEVMREQCENSPNFRVKLETLVGNSITAIAMSPE